jgi:hypothetical protein
MRLNPETITNWKIANKIRPIKAKPLVNLLVDRTITKKFLLDTLEGKEPLGDGVVICIGEAGDTWQQTSKKLLSKYVVKGIDVDGWMDCEPLPDNAVDCVEVTPEMNSLKYNVPPYFHIVGLWGATNPATGEKNIQSGAEGDFICRNQTDHTDVWIIRRQLFLNTYVIKS